MYKYVLFAFALLMPYLASAVSKSDNRQKLFETKSGDSIPYRIPAIATCSNGDLIAVSDYRYCGADIGLGHVDLHYRISKDNGKNWGPEQMLADGSGDESVGNVWNYAYGDCAICADRNSNEVIVLCAAGKSPYYSSTRNNPNRVALFRSHDNGKTWDKGKEITEQIYGLFDARQDGPIRSLFCGSGKIHQSRYVKVGKYYRLYTALCTKSGNFVIYSDDFGENWKVLGDINESCCEDGDEPKCEEEPDGSVILSSRAWGRMFNVFTFTNIQKGEGKWDRRAKALDFADIKNACNGEILLVPAIRLSDKSKTVLAIQSVPFGPKRTNVGFFYKDIRSPHLNAQELATDWHKGLQVSQQESAYSTMTLQHNYQIGFLWEEGPVFKGRGYCIDYLPLSVKTITKGQYTIDVTALKKGYRQLK